MIWAMLQGRTILGEGTYQSQFHFLTTFAMNSGARKKEYPFGGVLSANPHVYSGPDPAELFLNLNSNKGKQALLIPDFVSKVVPGIRVFRLS